MKTLLVLLACLTFVASSPPTEEEEFVKECAKLHDFSPDEIQALFSKDWDTTVSKRKVNCMAACMMRKKASYSGEFYDFMESLINTAIFEKRLVLVTTELRALLRKCRKEVGKEECALFQCLEFDKDPFHAFVFGH